MTRERALRLLNAVFFTAVAVSIVHYTDNTLNFDRFPQGDVGPEITRDTIWIAWVVFTSAGAAGYVLYRRGRMAPACALLALYSVSGLIGIGHYAVGGTSVFPWWRHAHVVADIACGAAVFAFAVWSARRFVARRAAASEL